LPRGDSSVEASASVDFEEASAAHSVIDDNAMDVDESSIVQESKTDDPHDADKQST
jgi:hypothetical protein